jgi:hypothetical protein
MQPLGDWLLMKDTDIPLRTSAQLLMDVVMEDVSSLSYVLFLQSCRLDESICDRFPSNIVVHMSSLFEYVFDQLHPIICRLASHEITERDEVLRHSDILFLWGRVIAFGKYLGHPSATYI